MRKCANIPPYMWRPLVIYDFATAPFWISLHIRKIWFSFLIVLVDSLACGMVTFQMPYANPIKTSLPTSTFSIPRCESHLTQLSALTSQPNTFSAPPVSNPWWLFKSSEVWKLFSPYKNLTYCPFILFGVFTYARPPVEVIRRAEQEVQSSWAHP